jgi:DNA-binding transcriptional LysR family regulator
VALRDGRRRGTRPLAPRLFTNSADAAICVAERDGGLARVLSYQAMEAIRAGGCASCWPEFEPPTRPIQIVRPAARLVSAKLRAFIDLAAEVADWDFS